MSPKNVKKVPPDGGYGWVIVFATALSNIVIIPLMQSFGLIFKDQFTYLGLSATQGSLIINLNSSFGMLSGLIHGVLLKIYGFRKMAFAAAFLVTLGVILTAYSTTFLHFMIAYGIITSLGMALGMSAYSLATNTYFKKNRGKAVSWAMTITGLGPILLPQLIYVLMKYHAIEGVTLILAGVMAQSFISASLLQPVKWHMRTEFTDEEEAKGGKEISKIEEEDEGEEAEADAKKEGGAKVEVNGNTDDKQSRVRLLRSVSQTEYPRARRRSSSLMNTSLFGSTLSIDHDVESSIMYGMDSAVGSSMLSVASANPQRRRTESVSQRYKSNHSLDEQAKPKASTRERVQSRAQPIDEVPLCTRFWRSFATYFDLDLLRDPIYVNIMVGMSLAIFAELNFSVLTAFILADIGLTTQQSATFMSTLGISDIIFRFAAPYIGDFLKLPVRTMYMLVLLMLIATRFTLLLTSNFYLLIFVALGLGIAKGIRTVYWSLVIPNYVPLEKLASAAGIQMMVNGVFILIGGPLLGVVRDMTGSYAWCIVIMNCVTFTTVVMWTAEYFITRYLKKKKEEDALQLEEEKEALK